MAAGEGRSGLVLGTHGDSTRDPINTSIASLTMLIGHPSTNLLVASRTSLHSAAITTCNKRPGDHYTTVAVLDSAFGGDRVLSGPSTTETDAELSGQSVRNECRAATSTDSDGVDNRIWRICQTLEQNWYIVYTDILS